MFFCGEGAFVEEDDEKQRVFEELWRERVERYWWLWREIERRESLWWWCEKKVLRRHGNVEAVAIVFLMSYLSAYSIFWFLARGFISRIYSLFLSLGLCLEQLQQLPYLES